MAGMELVVIDADTNLRRFKRELRWNEAAYTAGMPTAVSVRQAWRRSPGSLL